MGSRSTQAPITPSSLRGTARYGVCLERTSKKKRSFRIPMFPSSSALLETNSTAHDTVSTAKNHLVPETALSIFSHDLRFLSKISTARQTCLLSTSFHSGKLAGPLLRTLFKLPSSSHTTPSPKQQSSNFFISSSIRPCHTSTIPSLPSITMSAEQQQQENEWKPIGDAVGAGDVPVEVIESLCMECHEQVSIPDYSQYS